MAVSPILNLELVAPTQLDKTTTMNDLIVAIEAATNAPLDVDFSGGSVTLTFAQLTSAAVFRCSGQSAPVSMTIPLVSPEPTTVYRVFAVRNNGGFTVTVGGSTGTTVDVAAGAAAILECDGTNTVSYASGGIGPTGATGPAGGAVSIDYGFSAGTTDVDPGAGLLALNNATQDLATVIYVDLVDAHGKTWTSVLDTLDASTNPVKGQVRIFNKTDPTKWMVFELTGRVTATGYRKYAVSVIGSSAASPFSPGDNLAFAFTQTGDLPDTPVKATARWATVSALPTNIYANGSSGVGATLTATANGALTVDGGSVSTNDILLVKNEAAALGNGLYVVTNPGGPSAQYVLTRHVDLDEGTEFPGAYLAVISGTTNAGTAWLCTATSAPTMGTTAIAFEQLNVAVAYSPGSGISIIGAVIAADTTIARLASPTFTGTVTLPNTDVTLGSTIDMTAATEVKVPTPAAASDATTKAYVDLENQQVTMKPVARWATAAALPANTYNNGTSGSNATITGNSNGALTVDGGSPAAGDLILVMTEASQAHNGLYLVINPGGVSAAFVLSRAVSMDIASKYEGAVVPVAGNGSTNADTMWMCSIVGAPTVGSTAITFVPARIGSYSALPAEVQNSLLTVPFTDKPPAGKKIYLPVGQASTLPANFAGTSGYAPVVPLADSVFTVGYVRSGVETTVGTVKFAAGQSVLTLSTQAAVALLATDALWVLFPSPQDATLSGCSITIMLKKS